MTIYAKCPSCVSRLNLSRKARFNQRIVCPDCEAVLEIIRLDPPLLDWPLEDGEIYNSGFAPDYLYDDIYFEERR